MATIAEIRKQYPQYDDMSDADLANAFYAKYYSDMPRAEFDQKIGLNPAPAAPTGPKPSMGEKLGMGVGDTGLGIWQTLANVGPKSGGSYVPMPNVTGAAPTQEQQAASAADVNNLIDQREMGWQARRQASGDTGIEWARAVGAGVAAAPAMALFPEASPGFLPGLGMGAAQGFTTALTQPVIGAGEDFAGQKNVQLGVGSGIGGIVGGVLGKLGQPKQPPSEHKAAVSYLRERGVEPTIGQNISQNAATVEDATKYINLGVGYGQKRALETFNKGAYNEILAPLGVTYNGPAGRTGIKETANLISKGYDKIIPQLELKLSDDIRTEIGAAISDAATPDASIARTINNILDKNLYAKMENGALSGTGFKHAEELLGGYISDYGTGTATERQVAKGLKNILGILREGLETNNPELAGKLQALNKSYAMLTRVENAVPSGNVDGLFTPAQLARAVETGDRTIRHRAYVHGDALLQKYSDAGLRVLGNRFPDSGTAPRSMTTNPLSWLVSGAGTAIGGPFYTGPGQRAAGAVLNQPSLLTDASAANLRKLTPYTVPLLANFDIGQRSSLLDERGK